MHQGVARVKSTQYRRRVLDNAAWEPFTFPDERSLMAFCEKPPGYVMEIKVNGRTVFDRYLSVESSAYLPNLQHLGIPIKELQSPVEA